MQSEEPKSGAITAFFKNIESILAITCAAVATVILFIDPKMPAEHLNMAIGAICGILMLLSIKQLRTKDESVAVAKITTRFETTEESLKGLNKLLDHVSNALEKSGKLVKCPTSDPNVYVELFGGFTGTFNAFNPAYNIEYSPTLNDSEKMLIKEVYVPRYKISGKCTARYLFFTGDESGRKSLDRFKLLMSKVVSSGCSNVTKNLYVKVNKNKNAESHDEIYFGIQHGRPTVVHELSAPSEAYGKPSFYYVSGSIDLKDQCDKAFDNEWYRPENITLHDPSTPGSFFDEA